ncbi:hypothetical protein Tco_0007786 [Tanacetum coccineum]
MGTVSDVIVAGTEGAVQQSPVRAKVINDLSADEKERYKADIRATNILLQGIPKDIYSLINHYTDAKDKYGTMCRVLLEGIEAQWSDMRNIKMTMPRMQLNSKFVNNMLPEWSRFITEVKLNRGSNGLCYSSIQHNQPSLLHPQLTIPATTFNWTRANSEKQCNRNVIAGKVRSQKQRRHYQSGQAKPITFYNRKGLGHISREMSKAKATSMIQLLQGQDILFKTPGEWCSTGMKNSHCFLQENRVHNENGQKKAETSVPKPLSALTVYPPNTPVKLIPGVLPTKSQVKINRYITRAHTSEKTSTMLNEIESLKAQLRSKVSCVTSDSVKPKVLAPGMYAIDVKPIPHPLKNNRSAHLNYISHLKESVEIELLEYVIGTCPKSFNERDNKAPSTPVNRKKQVTFNDKPGTSSSNTQKHEVHPKVQQTNIPVIPSTGVYTSTEASGSKPRSNTKKNRIMPAKTKNKKKVEDHPRTNKSVWTKVNQVDSSISSKRVVINLNSKSVCKTYNKCLNSASHEMYVVNILNSVNATPTVKNCLNKGKQI